MKFLFDFFPLLLFFIAYKFYGIYTATAVVIAASFLQVGLFWLKHRRFENLHLITLAVIVVFGGLTLALQNDAFIKLKPTILYWAFASLLAASHFFGNKTIIERMMGSQITLPAPVWRQLNLSWAIFFLLLGILNLYVVFYFAVDLDTDTRTAIWVNFKVWVTTGLTLVFVIGQAIYMSRHAVVVNDADEKHP
jgi:intracellular septation protein